MKKFFVILALVACLIMSGWICMTWKIDERNMEESEIASRTPLYLSLIGKGTSRLVDYDQGDVGFPTGISIHWELDDSLTIYHYLSMRGEAEVWKFYIDGFLREYRHYTHYDQGMGAGGKVIILHPMEMYPSPLYQFRSEESMEAGNALKIKYTLSFYPRYHENAQYFQQEADALIQRLSLPSKP